MSEQPARVSPRWRIAAMVLGVGLLLSWGYFAYRLVDMGISLTYCRAEQEHQRQDIAFLVQVGAGQLSSEHFLAVMAKVEPDLPGRLDEDNTLTLRTMALQFGSDSLLQGSVK